MTEHILQLLNLSIVQMWKHLTGNLMKYPVVNAS